MMVCITLLIIMCKIMDNIGAWMRSWGVWIYILVIIHRWRGRMWQVCNGWPVKPGQQLRCFRPPNSCHTWLVHSASPSAEEKYQGSGSSSHKYVLTNTTITISQITWWELAAIWSNNCKNNPIFVIMIACCLIIFQVKQFWEYTFQCRFAPPPKGWVDAGGLICNGQENLDNVQTEFLDISNLRPEYNVYKAVYALAYALDDMMQCKPGGGPFSGHSCGNLKQLEPWQVWCQIQVLMVKILKDLV